jgi:hypothetical protein
MQKVLNIIPEETYYDKSMPTLTLSLWNPSPEQEPTKETRLWEKTVYVWRQPSKQEQEETVIQFSAKAV